jgi:3-dehydroquinate dehydratase
MKYKILWDYNSENWVFHDGEFDSIDEAVKQALSQSYSAKFIIVSVHDWKAEPVTHP